MFKKHKGLVKDVHDLSVRLDFLHSLLEESGIIEPDRSYRHPLWRNYRVRHWVSCIRDELSVLIEGLGYEIEMEPEKAIEPKMVLRKKVAK